MSVRPLNFTKEDKVNLSVFVPGGAQRGRNDLWLGANTERHAGFGTEEAGSVQHRDNYSICMGQGNSGPGRVHIVNLKQGLFDLF